MGTCLRKGAEATSITWGIKGARRRNRGTLDVGTHACHRGVWICAFGGAGFGFLHGALRLRRQPFRCRQRLYRDRRGRAGFALFERAIQQRQCLGSGSLRHAGPRPGHAERSWRKRLRLGRRDDGRSEHAQRAGSHPRKPGRPVSGGEWRERLLDGALHILDRRQRPLLHPFQHGSDPCRSNRGHDRRGDVRGPDGGRARRRRR